MPEDARTRKHARLVHRMADAVGIDLHEQMMRGLITGRGIDEAVLSCTNCTDPEACEHWLKAQEGRVSEAAPEGCRNEKLFAALRAGKPV